MFFNNHPIEDHFTIKLKGYSIDRDKLIKVLTTLKVNYSSVWEVRGETFIQFKQHGRTKAYSIAKAQAKLKQCGYEYVKDFLGHPVNIGIDHRHL